ncbi:1248_t:CDS:2 [Gigaspora rosea]|nr:1248_t:CDS:2 [Gigaspora rosea]
MVDTGIVSLQKLFLPFFKQQKLAKNSYKARLHFYRQTICTELQKGISILEAEYKDFKNERLHEKILKVISKTMLVQE